MGLFRPGFNFGHLKARVAPGPNYGPVGVIGHGYPEDGETIIQDIGASKVRQSNYPAGCWLLTAPPGRLQAADCSTRPTAGCRLLAADCYTRPTAGCRRLATDYWLLTAPPGRLLAADCWLPTTG